MTFRPVVRLATPGTFRGLRRSSRPMEKALEQPGVEDYPYLEYILGRVRVARAEADGHDRPRRGSRHGDPGWLDPERILPNPGLL